jgi:hypothetical protein
VTIGNSVTKIGEDAFAWCSNLQSVTIPRNCEVGKDAFPDGCKVFRRVDEKRIDKTNSAAMELQTAKAQGIQFSDDGKTLIKCPGYGKKVVIPSCVTAIGKSAVERWTDLQSVNIPNSVTNIGFWAFYGCDNLQSVNIPRNCKVGQDAFPDRCKVIRR